MWGSFLAGMGTTFAVGRSSVKQSKPTGRRAAAGRGAAQTPRLGSSACGPGLKEGVDGRGTHVFSSAPHKGSR